MLIRDSVQGIIDSEKSLSWDDSALLYEARCKWNAYPNIFQRATT